MPLKSYQDPLPELNLTPMIDVVFNLIIFFMVGTKFAEMDRAVELQLPRVANVKNLSVVRPNRVVEVQRDGVIRLDSETVTLAELTDRLRSEASDGQVNAVTVRGDGAGPLEQVARVLTACRDAGISDLAITVQSDKTRR